MSIWRTMFSAGRTTVLLANFQIGKMEKEELARDRDANTHFVQVTNKLKSIIA